MFIKKATSSVKKRAGRACFHFALDCATVVRGCRAAERLAHDAWLCSTDHLLHSDRTVENLMQSVGSQPVESR